MTDYKVNIPEESYTLIKFNQDNMPGIACVNTALRSFDHRIVFSWHLSLMLSFSDLIDNGMPSKSEREIVDSFFDKMEDDLKGDPVKPNGLFLARITWNATRELIWRIYDPEISDKYLKEIIRINSSPRTFDYRMENDPEWKLAEWHLKDVK